MIRERVLQRVLLYFMDHISRSLAQPMDWFQFVDYIVAKIWHFKFDRLTNLCRHLIWWIKTPVNGLMYTCKFGDNAHHIHNYIHNILKVFCISKGDTILV